MTDTVMIVDDNNIEREIFSNALIKHGMETVTTGDPTKALILAVEKKPKFIILDLYMPNIDGFEVCKMLKSDPRTSDIPILFITSSPQTSDVRTGFHLGCVDYINKPIDVHDLVELIGMHRILHEFQEAYKPLRQCLEKFTKKYLSEGDKVG